MKKMLWIDMEMTGLNVEKEVPIEIAAIITDLDFNILDTYEAVIQQPQQYIDAMDDWNKKHHGASGLIAKIPHGKPAEQVENEILNLINKHFVGNEKDDRPVICGNSISQDRLFIDKYFTKLSSRLHYRMLDVTGFKVVFNNKYNKEFKKQDKHRALDDIQESIEELKYYLQFIKI